MLAKVISGANIGLDAIPITVEVDVSLQSLPSFTIVGLADRAVEESKERVRAAFRNSGCDFPLHKITVNLAPADMPKEGPAYDLPMALGLLLASEQLEADVSRAVFLGELSLDGGLRHTAGILPMVALARERGFKGAYVPAVDAAEATLVEGLEIVPVESLAALVAHLRGEKPIPPALPAEEGT